VFYIFFLENFIDGIIPPIRPQKPLYKGGYGRGEGVPIPYRGVYGGYDYYIRGSPSHTQLLYYIPMALPTTTRTMIHTTKRRKALNGLFILWGFLIVVQIYGDLSIYTKKRKGTIVPLLQSPLLLLVLLKHLDPVLLRLSLGADNKCHHIYIHSC
jgi:hypothetical protein